VWSGGKGGDNLKTLPITIVYKIEGAIIGQNLKHLIESEGFQTEDYLIVEALDLFAKVNVDFSDCYLSVKSNNNKSPIITLANDFKKLNCEWYKPISFIQS
jgi:predicted nucleic-acid-binding protein